MGSEFESEEKHRAFVVADALTSPMIFCYFTSLDGTLLSFRFFIAYNDAVMES